MNKFLLLCILVSLNLHAVAESSPESIELRNAFISWSSSLHSFKGKYTLYERTAEKFYITHVDYRYYNDNKYLKVIYEDRENLTVEEAILDSQSTRLNTKYVNGEPKHDVILPKRATSLYIPQPSIQSPETLFFHEATLLTAGSLAKALIEGSLEVRGVNDQTVLIHKLEGIRHDIYFDDMRRVTRIDVGGAPNDAEIALAAKEDIDPFDYHWDYYSVRYDDYTLINDVWFPIKVTRISFSPTPESQRIIDARNNGQMDHASASLAVITSGGFLEDRLSELVFDKETLVLNQPLDKSDFEIVLPENTLFVKDGLVLHEPPWQWSKQMIIFGSLLTALAFCALALFIRGIRRRSSSKTRY